MTRLSTCVAYTDKVKCFAHASALIFGALAISGCAMGGGNAIDNNFTSSAISIADNTPSIAPDPFSAPEPNVNAGQTDRLLDEDTIRLAVTTANINKLNDGTLAWANESTGSSGDISSIIQRVEAGQTCRSFKATREAYDGATLYNGDICLDKRSGWWTRLLAPLDNG